MTRWSKFVLPMGAVTAVMVATSLAMQFDIGAAAGRSPAIGPPWAGGLACLVSFIAFAVAVKRKEAASDSFSDGE